MQLAIAIIILIINFSGSASAQTKSVADLANYRGADREEIRRMFAEVGPLS